MVSCAPLDRFGKVLTVIVPGIDEIFTILMSTGVESRREYIERHALEATYLDV